MTTVSKCLVVFAVAASLAFLGFAAAVLQGGANLKAQLKDPLLRDYVFETAVSKEKGTTYSVKKRKPESGAAQPADGEEVAEGDEEAAGSAPTGESLQRDSAVLAQVIIAARKDLKKEQDDEKERLRREIEGYEENERKVPGLQDKIKRAKAEIEADTRAMEKREKQLVDELQRIQKAISDVTESAQKQSVEANQLRNLATRRREDVFRLENQLKELQTDKFRAVEQRKKLDDLLIRLQSKVDRLKRRNKQLKY